MKTEIQNDILHISGEVSVKTVTAAAFVQFEQQCRLNSINGLDCSGISRADSACVSLLLAALRWRGKDFAIRYLPKSVQDLSSLYNINDWFH